MLILDIFYFVYMHPPFICSTRVSKKSANSALSTSIMNLLQSRNEEAIDAIHR